MFVSLVQKSYVGKAPPNAPPYYKIADFTDVDVIRQQRSTVFRVMLINRGNYPITINSYRKIQTINGFNTPGFNPMGQPGQQNRSWGFNYSFNQSATLDITTSTNRHNFYKLDTPLVLKAFTSEIFAEIFYDGNGLTEKELHYDYGVMFEFYTDDLQNETKIYSDNLQNNQVILQGHPVGLRWQPQAKIIYKKNIHGYLDTPKIKNLDVWKKYASKRITETITGYAAGRSGLGTTWFPSVERITISDFLKKTSFLNNKKFDDRFPEMKRVLNRFENPIPSYDFIWPYGDNYAYNGTRRTYDYQPGSRLDRYYSGLQTIFLRPDIRSRISHEFIDKREMAASVGALGVDPSIIKEKGNKWVARQRREWGFREKVIQGFPYFIPKSVETRVSPTSTVFGGCGNGPIIAGFVTAGSGIFSGIQPAVSVEYDQREAKRTVRSASDQPYGRPRVPNGLIFIQDETGAIGFSIGTDMRYMDDPMRHNSNFAEPALNDRMHIGSYGLPKPDYRHFLREGDLVIIQIGVGFKYWHPVLGVEPRHWESLIGYRELEKENEYEDLTESDEWTSDFSKMTGIPESIVDIVDELFWPHPMKYYPNIRPYIDNWGGYTRPEINKDAKEAAIDIPSLEILGEDDQPELFDTGFASDSSVSELMRYRVFQLSSYISVGADIVKQLISSVTNPWLFAIGALMQIGAVAMVSRIFLRNRYILPTRAIRDTQYPFTDFYPQQEEHPWSTGTPIPVNSGMEYIMSEVFSVDTRERFAPPPLEISAAQLRGIPEESWKYDPKCEWSYPYFHQFMAEYEHKYNKKVNPYHLTVKNQYSEFPGIEDEPVTPYTENPGSQYKGLLVKLKNVTFVEPPSKEFYVPIAADKQTMDVIKKEFSQVEKDLQDFLKNNPDKNITDFKLSLKGGNPEIMNNLPQIQAGVQKITDAISPIIILIETVVRLFGGSNPYTQFTQNFLEAVRRVALRVKDMTDKLVEMQGGEYSGFRNQYEMLQFLTIKHGVDLAGFRMDINYPREIASMVIRTVGTIDLDKLLQDLSLTIVDGVFNVAGAGGIGKAFRQLDLVWKTYAIPEINEINEFYNGPAARTLKYEKITMKSDFPWSVDRRDGGYWWACPYIPLPNARSHQNDSLYGDPNNDDDNENGLFFDNRDTGLSFISNTTERTVFTQLVSSNKKEHFVPIFDEMDIDWGIFEGFGSGDVNTFLDVYGLKHSYTTYYIKERYVQDLGYEYIDQYEPFANEWKPYKERGYGYVINCDPSTLRGSDSDEGSNNNQSLLTLGGNNLTTGTTLQSLPELNYFEPVRAGSRFFGNKVYYVKDEKNVVVPIRINSNTEIARFAPLVPTEPVDIVGIAWQYSSGKPGLEWERERYIMQVWPRYLSDVGIKWQPEEKKDESVDVTERDRDVTIVRPRTPETPKRLPDLTIDSGDFNPAELDCDNVRDYLDSLNQLKTDYINASSWPIISTSNGINVHQDPVTGKQIGLSIDPNAVKQLIASMPDYPCSGMNIGQEREVLIGSSNFGTSRRFYFTVGPDGECLCTMYQPGTEYNRITEVADVTRVNTNIITPPGDVGIIRRGNNTEMPGGRTYG